MTWTPVARIFELSLRQMLRSRRTVFLALLAGGPALLALGARLAGEAAVTTVRVNGVTVDGASMFGMMIWMLFVRFIVPVLGVFYGTALIADEVEDRTITYLFTRPVRRGAVLIGKYLAYLVCTALVVLPAVMVVHLLLVPPREASAFMPLLQDLGILALGLAVYGALFALVGAALKRPLVAGLLFAFGWEQVALIVPGYLRRFTVAYYLQSLVPHATSDGAISLFDAVRDEVPSPASSLFWLAVVLLGSLYLAARAVERREYGLE
jgi:ABC-2 type transport system permease protein